MRASAIRWVVVAGACLSVSGCCDKVVEKAAEKAAEKAVEEATGGDASVAFGENVDISDLPAAFRYPGAKARGRFSQNMPTGAGTAYIMESDDALARVKAHYAAISGYKQLAKMDTPQSTVYNYETASGKESYHITVTQNGGKTGITIVSTKNAP
jgi:hypothetical protein